jgi:uncharacterized membrane protein YccF (DUF307 family)
MPDVSIFLYEVFTYHLHLRRVMRHIPLFARSAVTLCFTNFCTHVTAVSLHPFLISESLRDRGENGTSGCIVWIFTTNLINTFWYEVYGIWKGQRNLQTDAAVGNHVSYL